MWEVSSMLFFLRLLLDKLTNLLHNLAVIVVFISFHSSFLFLLYPFIILWISKIILLQIKSQMWKNLISDQETHNKKSQQHFDIFKQNYNFFETGSCYEIPAGLQLAIFLSQPLQCQDDWCEPPYLAETDLFTISLTQSSPFPSYHLFLPLPMLFFVDSFTAIYCETAKCCSSPTNAIVF